MGAIPSDVVAMLDEHFDECEWVVESGPAWWRAVMAESCDEPCWSIECTVCQRLSVEYEHGWYCQSGECDDDAESLRDLMLAMVAAAAALNRVLSEREGV